MSKLSTGFAAGVVARLVVALSNLLAMPFYLKVLGERDFGIVGIFLTLQILVNFLDMGLGATLIRKLSATHQKSSNLTIQNVKTFELAYFLLSCIAAVLMLLTMPWLVKNWFEFSVHEFSTMILNLILASLCVCIYWFSSIYIHIMTGLERQHVLAYVQILSTAMRTFIPICSLMIAADLTVFFLANLLAAVLQVLLMRSVSSHYLPEHLTTLEKRYDFRLLLDEKGFSLGMLGITLTTLIITQTDKIILSKMLSLTDYGLYALCFSLATGIYLVVQPLFAILYPRFVRLMSTSSDHGNQHELRKLYQLGSQLMALMVIPFSVTVIAFAETILHVWTGSSDVANKGALILRILVAANAINAIMNLPFCLQLASGWTSIALKVNILAMVFLLPSLIVAVTQYGMIGGAAILLILHIGIILIIPHITFSRLLIGEKQAWYVKACILPSFSCALLAMFVQFLWQATGTRWIDFLFLFTFFVVSSLFVLMTLNDLRNRVLEWLMSQNNAIFKRVR